LVNDLVRRDIASRAFAFDDRNDCLCRNDPIGWWTGWRSCRLCRSPAIILPFFSLGPRNSFR